MARRRMIEVSIAYDKEFNSLSLFAQLVFLKILPHTDDYGRFTADAEDIKVRTDPYSKEPAENFEAALKEIADKGLWFVYELPNKRRVLQYKQTTFERINAFLIKKRGNPEYEPYIKVYKVIYGDINLYPIESIKQKVKSIKQKEGVVGGEKSTDKVFTELWCIEYEKILKRKYKNGGVKDAQAVKRLLASGATPEQLVEIAKSAWAHRDLFNCKQSVTIAGFDSRFNNILEEIENAVSQRTNGKPQSDQTRRAEYNGAGLRERQNEVLRLLEVARGGNN